MLAHLYILLEKMDYAFKQIFPPPLKYPLRFNKSKHPIWILKTTNSVYTKKDYLMVLYGVYLLKTNSLCTTSAHAVDMRGTCTWLDNRNKQSFPPQIYNECTVDLPLVNQSQRLPDSKHTEPSTSEWQPALLTVPAFILGSLPMSCMNAGSSWQTVTVRWTRVWCI